MVVNTEIYDKMIANPLTLSDGALEESLRVGKLYEAFGGEALSYNPPEGICAIVRYMLLFYDMKSPLREKKPDISERKHEAALLAQLPDEEERLNDIFYLKDAELTVLIYNFLRFQNSMEFMLLSTNIEVFWSINANIIKEVKEIKDDKQAEEAYAKKAANLQNAERILENVHRLESKIFADPNDGDVIKKLVQSRPEARAQRAKNGPSHTS
jgi:hypothetical protein